MPRLVTRQSEIIVRTENISLVKTMFQVSRIISPTCNTSRNAELGGDSRHEMSEQLLDEDVRGEEQSDGDREEEEHVGPALLWRGRHELGVIETEEQTDGEYWQQAPVKHLSNQDYFDAGN